MACPKTKRENPNETKPKSNQNQKKNKRTEQKEQKEQKGENSGTRSMPRACYLVFYYLIANAQNTSAKRNRTNRLAWHHRVAVRLIVSAPTPIKPCCSSCRRFPTAVVLQREPERRRLAACLPDRPRDGAHVSRTGCGCDRGLVLAGHEAPRVLRGG